MVDLNVPMSLSPELRDRCLLGVVRLRDLKVARADDQVQKLLDEALKQIEESYRGLKPGDIGELEAARELYRSLSIDPTKTRPSSEALLRRVMLGKGLARVNSLVDAVNLCSLRLLLPFGLYDVDRLAPPIVMRLGRQGEAYEGIRKEAVHIEARPVLADEKGPFGNPTSDSLRTAISEGTRKALVVIFAPSSYNPGKLEKGANQVGQWLEAMGFQTFGRAQLVG
ncbi:MAG: phenylalanine--tRNA ligase beta subunit-related protein [Candidatus Eisenbacteria bacterium]